MRPLLTGKLVNLAGVDPDEMSKAFAGWDHDSELQRLMDSSPARNWSRKSVKEHLEKLLDEAGNRSYWFTIRRVEDNQLLGDISLDIVSWSTREAFVGLGIGPRDFWGKGYGTEAMHLMLEYAFLEINLYRVTLTVFEYNPRAIRSYEKAGFCHEGRVRAALFREGKRWDMFFMGILREEWLEKNDCELTKQ